MTTAEYDTFAEAYVEENENGVFNNWYERPEMLRLVGDVEGGAFWMPAAVTGP